MTGPKSVDLSPALRSAQPAIARSAPAPAEAEPAAPTDQAVIGQAPAAVGGQDQLATAATEAPAEKPKKTLLVQMQVDSDLVESGQIGELEPVFVKSADKASPVVVTAPTVLNAFEEPPAPDGSVNFPAAVPVLKDILDSGQIQNYHAALVPNDAMEPMSQSTYNGKLNEAYEKGHKDALPPGMVPKVADSKKGMRTQQLSVLGSQLIGEVGGNFATTSLSGIWQAIPAGVAAPLALTAASLQTFGPNGHLKNLKDMQDQTAWLENYRDNEGKDKINLAVGPQGTLVPTATEQPINETLGNLKASETATKVKLAGTGLLAGAGITALIGGAALAATPVLATGAMIAPVASGLVTQKHQMDNLRAQKADLVAQQAAGKTTVPVPVVDQNGNVSQVEKPIDEQIANVTKQIKMTALQMSVSVTSAGMITAIAAGVPFMFALGGLAIPAAIGVAMFPKETWEFVKSLPAKLVDVLKGIGNWIGRQTSKIFGGGKEKQALETVDKAAPAAGSPAVEKLRSAFAELRTANPEQAERLQAAVERLNAPPSTQEELAAYQAAAGELNASLAELAKSNPEAVANWQAGMQEFKAEQAQVQQEMLGKAVAEFMEKQGNQVLQQPEVREAAGRLSISDAQATGLLESMAKAQFTGDGSELGAIVQKANAGDAASRNLLEFGQTVEAAFAKANGQANAAAPAA